jgi:uncharacterized membrane protein YjjP (DUF1212 family)
MHTRRQRTELLAHAGRLLLEFNESTGEIHRALAETVRALTDEVCHVAVTYVGVAVSLAGDSPVLMPVRELRNNTALLARIHAILAEVRRGGLGPSEAVARLERVEADTPRHSRWLAVLLLGAAAASLAGLLGADAGAVATAGLATGLGLLARQELVRCRVNFLLLPFTAAFLGAVLAGLAIRQDWTRTPGLALIVPSLMLVPGPHLINWLLDLIDNHLPMSLARLGLAVGILLASALGMVSGMELTLPELLPGEPGAAADHLNLLADMLLAGVVTCGFAVSFNTAWGHIPLAVLGGMAGHGLRFVALEAGWHLESATLLGGLAVGVVSAWMARSKRTPVAVIAFAGVVTMMPGLQMYRALGGALQLARQGDAAELPTVAGTLGNALQACFVVGALTIGLVVGARAVLTLAGEWDTPAGPRAGSHAEAGSVVGGAQP